MSLKTNIEEIVLLDKAERLQLIRSYAVELFEGDKVSSEHWLTSSIPALALKTPLDYANTVEGTKEVILLIGRLEHGVFT